MRNRIVLSTITAAGLGAGLLLAGAGTSAANAAQVDQLTPITPGITLVEVPPTIVTTTRPTIDLCKRAPQLCHPPVDPCTGKPIRVLTENGLTVRTLTTRTLTTKPCPTTTSTTRPAGKPPVTVDPPVRVRPTFTG